MSKEYIPYTYLIGWSKLDKWYYGAEYAQKTKIANPENFWSSYFTSSEYVKEFRQIHGDPDIVEIRKTFKNEEECREWEHKVLRRMKVIYSNKWLNESNCKAISPKISSEFHKNLWKNNQHFLQNPEYIEKFNNLKMEGKLPQQQPEFREQKRKIEEFKLENGIHISQLDPDHMEYMRSFVDVENLREVIRQRELEKSANGTHTFKQPEFIAWNIQRQKDLASLGLHPSQRPEMVAAFSKRITEQNLRLAAEGLHPSQQPENKKQKSDYQKNLYAKGLHNSQREEHKIRQSQMMLDLAAKGELTFQSEEFKKQNAERLHQRYLDGEHVSQIFVECPVCKEMVNIATAGRNHFENCGKKRIRITNGLEEKHMFIDEEIPEGFWVGHKECKTTKNMKRYTNGIVNITLGESDEIPEGFRPGLTRKKKS